MVELEALLAAESGRDATIADSHNQLAAALEINLGRIMDEQRRHADMLQRVLDCLPDAGCSIGSLETAEEEDEGEEWGEDESWEVEEETEEEEVEVEEVAAVVEEQEEEEEEFYSEE